MIWPFIKSPVLYEGQFLTLVLTEQWLHGGKWGKSDIWSELVQRNTHTHADWHSKYCLVLSRNHLSRFSPLPSRLHQLLWWIPREFSGQSKEQRVLGQPPAPPLGWTCSGHQSCRFNITCWWVGADITPQMKNDNSDNGPTKDSSTFSQGTVTWSQTQRCREATFYSPVWTPRYWQIVGGLFRNPHPPSPSRGPHWTPTWGVAAGQSSRNPLGSALSLAVQHLHLVWRFTRNQFVIVGCPRVNLSQTLGSSGQTETRPLS